MAISLHTTLRNNRADAITSFVAGSAKLRIYTASYATLLVENICNATFAGSASGGVLTLNSIADGVAAASGDGAVARLYKSDGSTLAITGLTVSDSGGSGDIKLQQTGVTISSGQTISYSGSQTISEGNA